MSSGVLKHSPLGAVVILDVVSMGESGVVVFGLIVVDPVVNSNRSKCSVSSFKSKPSRSKIDFESKSFDLLAQINSDPRYRLK